MAFLLPPLLFYGATVLFPIGEAILQSLYNWGGITPPKFVGLANYSQMFSADPTFREAARNSLVYLAVSLVLEVGVGLIVANALSYLVRRWRDFIKTLYLLPAILSTVTISLFFQTRLLERAERPYRQAALRRGPQLALSAMALGHPHCAGGRFDPRRLAAHGSLHSDPAGGDLDRAEGE